MTTKAAYGKQLKGRLVDRLTENLDPLDLMIFSGGAIAGYHGMTPTTAMFSALNGVNAASDVLSGVASAAQKVASLNPLYLGVSETETGILGALGIHPQTASGSSTSSDPSIGIRTSLAMVGGIEAIMVTRPGFAPALLQMAGSVLGDLKSLGGAALAGSIG